MNKPSNLSYSCKQIAKMSRNGVFNFDITIQRQEVWKAKRKSLLIDSIIKGFPVPPIYLVKTDRTMKDERGRTVFVYDCIDGKQRCTTISAFRNNEFKLVGLGDPELDGKYYNDLTEAQKEAFDDATILSYFFITIDDDEIVDMMSRLNNGKPITNTELARIKSKDIHTIQKLADSPVLTKNLTPAALNGYANEDIIVKLYLMIYKKNYELSSKNVRAAFENEKFSDAQVSEMLKILDIADKAYDIIVKAPRKTYKKAIQRTNILSLLNLIYTNPDKSTPETIAEFAKYFFTPEKGVMSISKVYNEAMVNGTNHQKNVVARIDAMAGEFAKFCKDKEKDEDEDIETDQISLI